MVCLYGFRSDIKAKINDKICTFKRPGNCFNTLYVWVCLRISQDSFLLLILFCRVPLFLKSLLNSFSLAHLFRPTIKLSSLSSSMSPLALECFPLIPCTLIQGGSVLHFLHCFSLTWQISNIQRRSLNLQKECMIRRFLNCFDCEQFHCPQRISLLDGSVLFHFNALKPNI